VFRSGSLPSETVNEVCDGIRVRLENADFKKYVNCILTSHMVKNPPDYEAGLLVLKKLEGSFWYS
jgi:elongator complex protein 1